MTYMLIFALMLGPDVPGVIAGYYPTLQACMRAGGEAEVVIINKNGDPRPADGQPAPFMCYAIRGA